MSEQNKAIELAEWLEKHENGELIKQKIADKLRRLDAENAQLREQIAKLARQEPVGMVVGHTSQYGGNNIVSCGYLLPIYSAVYARPAKQPDGDGMCNNADNPGIRCVCREEFGHRVCDKQPDGALVDERGAFELKVREHFDPMRADELLYRGESGAYDEWGVLLAWEAWQARAALAQPAPAAVPDGWQAWTPIETELPTEGEFVFVLRTNGMVRIAKRVGGKPLTQDQDKSRNDWWRGTWPMESSWSDTTTAAWASLDSVVAMLAAPQAQEAKR